MSICVVMGGAGKVGAAIVAVLSKKNTAIVSEINNEPEVSSVELTILLLPKSIVPPNSPEKTSPNSYS